MEFLSSTYILNNTVVFSKQQMMVRFTYNPQYIVTWIVEKSHSKFVERVAQNENSHIFDMWEFCYLVWFLESHFVETLGEEKGMQKSALYKNRAFLKILLVIIWLFHCITKNGVVNYAKKENGIAVLRR